MQKSYQICTHCIMDTTDPDIKFDQAGLCNHCLQYQRVDQTALPMNQNEKTKKLDIIVSKIKRDGLNKKYDCLIGVSGGADSTYVAYIVKKMGLRPLAVHLDNGWDSELAVSNVEKVLNKLSIDLYTYVINWEEFKDIQLSFLKASTPDSEIPSDHAIVATIYKVAAKHNIQYIIMGTNAATEAIMPSAWSHGHIDWKYIKSIQKKFGVKRIKSFPHYNFTKLFYYKFIKRQKSISILDYLPYDKREAMAILERELDWRNYGGKHYESVYTRFFQGYILPKKFNFDKRRAHLSTLICSGQITRDEALKRIKENDYSDDLAKTDREFVIKKLGITEDEFKKIMELRKKSFWDYPSYEKNIFFSIGEKIYLSLRKIGLFT